MVEFEIETIDIGLFVRMSSDYVIPIFSDYVILIFKRQEVTYLRTRYIEQKQHRKFKYPITNIIEFKYLTPKFLIH